MSVSDALRAFSIRTLVAAKDQDANKALISTIVRERRSNFLSTALHRFHNVTTLDINFLQ